MHDPLLAYLLQDLANRCMLRVYVPNFAQRACSHSVCEQALTEHHAHGLASCCPSDYRAKVLYVLAATCAHAFVQRLHIPCHEQAAGDCQTCGKYPRKAAKRAQTDTVRKRMWCVCVCVCVCLFMRERERERERERKEEKEKEIICICVSVTTNT
jgi:hypothetical protein